MFGFNIGQNPKRTVAPSVVNFTTLPNAGPYASLGTVNIAGLPNLTISADTPATGTYFGTQANPLKYNVVTINNAKRFFASAADRNWQIHLWFNTLILNGEISSNGGDASSPQPTPCVPGATDGGSGGTGADGGQGGGGSQGICGCGIGNGGSAGTECWDYPPSFAYPVGEATGATCLGVTAGRGEGGFGSQPDAGDPTDAGGAGGGAAGLVSLIGNTITGSATSRLSANGGSFTLNKNSNIYTQTNGGNGVIYVAAMVYNGLIPAARVTGYSKTLKQILSNMTLSADKAFNQSWVYT